MPQVLAAEAVGYFLTTKLLVESAIVIALAKAATTLVVGQLFGKKDRAAEAPTQTFDSRQQERQVTIRSAVAAREVVYGTVVKAGTLVDAFVTRDYGSAQANENHNVPGVGALTVAVGNASSYRSTVAVYAITLVPVDEGGVYNEELTALSATSGAPGANEYSVSGGTYTFHSSRAGQPVRILYEYGTAEVTNSYLHLVIALAGHQVNAINTVYFNQDAIANGDLDGSGNVVSGKYAYYVRIKKHLGTTTQAADPDLIADSRGRWTASMQGKGVAYLYIRLRRNVELFPSGLPNIRASIQGALLYDPRSATTAFSNNWALAVYDYLTRREGLGCAASEISSTLLNAAANVADETVQIDAGGTTQARYTADGYVVTSDQPLDVLKRLLAAGAGTAIYSGATWDVYAGAYASPSQSLTVSDLAGPITGSADIERRDAFNGVRGTFVNPDGDWQPTDFPPVTNATYVAQDNNEEIWRDVVMDFVTNEIRAQRLAKIFLERARQATSCVWPGKPKLFGINTWSTVDVTVAQLGWSAKVFRVMGWRWQPAGQVDLVLQEDASGIYDWSYGEATSQDLSPNTTLPNAGVVAPPGNPVVTETKIAVSDQRDVAVKVTIAATASLDAFVERYQFEYKLAAASAWTVLPAVGVPQTVLFDVPTGVYDWRVKAINGLGRSSIYAQTRQEIVGLSDTPADATIVGLQTAGNLAILTIEKTADLDVERGGRVLVRHTAATTGQSWEESFSIGEANGYPGGSTVLVLPLKAGSYGVRFEDRTGRRSANVAWIATKQASVLTYSTVDTLQEDTTFPGTKSNCTAVDGILKLSGAGLFDDIPDFDSISSLDNYGGVEASGTYTFSAGLDFGAVTRVRLTGNIQGLTVNVNDRIDDRLDNIDTWASFDGDTGGGSCDAWLEVRETDDDPTGTPTWSAWKRLDAAEMQCWGAEFRLQLRSADTAYNIHVNTLRVTAEQVA